MKQHTEECDCVDCEAELAKHFKQRITKEQWNEINKPEQEYIIKEFKFYNIDLPTKGDIWKKVIHEELSLLTIGQMIEFLGDDWFEIIVEEKNAEWDKKKNQININITHVHKNNICDQLWEAVKYKLKEK